MTVLLTWSDRGPRRAHHGDRPSADLGPIRRLLDQPESQGRYSRVLMLSNAASLEVARERAAQIRSEGLRVELRLVEAPDPSDYAGLFAAVGPLVAALPSSEPVDVLLSAGTPQAQTLWFILVQAGLLRARMLQVMPPDLVPDPHPRAIREVKLEIEGFPQIRALREEVARLRAEVGERGRELVGESPPMELLRRQISRVAPTPLPVLVRGETGTGKELVARALHAASARAQGPFIAENCGTFAEGVLASELFGHEKGAFTGAAGRRRGLFELAHGGTLFLDEVGELSPRVQVLLLRVLQEGTLRRVGGEAPIQVDVRVIAATHRDLEAMVRTGEFREDLYFRLRGATLRVPPLRERGGDIDLLVARFLAESGARLSLSPEARAALRGYRWPGNVRELRAEVIRWTVFCDDRVTPADLSPELLGAPASAQEAPPDALSDAGMTLAEAVATTERVLIADALAHHRGNLSRTARALGVDRNTLKRKIKRYNLR
jgi:two-component system response regulator AtoC